MNVFLQNGKKQKQAKQTKQNKKTVNYKSLCLAPLLQMLGDFEPVTSPLGDSVYNL